MSPSPRRIVMIQNDLYLVNTRKAILERNGYRVEAVHTIDEARAKCKELVCDLVIVDSEENHSKAMELCEEIKAGNPNLSVAVIAWYNTPADSNCPDEIIRREEGPEGLVSAVKSALA